MNTDRKACVYIISYQKQFFNYCLFTNSALSWRKNHYLCKMNRVRLWNETLSINKLL